MTTCEFIKAAVDVGTGAAAIVGAGVAVAGLRTWRAQLRGKTEYELARRLLRGVFEIRDQVSSVRNPFISGEEMAAAFKEVGVEPKEGDMMRDKRTNGFVYQQRWKGLSKALSDVRVDVLAAEVLWGEPVRDADKALRFCIAELNVSLTMYLRAMKDDRPMSKQIGEQIEKYSKVIYQLSDDPAEDLFTGKVSDAVKRFETLLRPHLTLGLRSSSKKAI